MSRPLRVLIIEDSENDTLLMVDALKRGGYSPQYRQVSTAEEMRQALKENEWDVILSDHNMPSFSSPAALQIIQECGMDVPFIIVSGAIGEETAVVAMKSGANDYLMKENLARLVPAIEREIREALVRAARKDAEEALKESERRNRLLWENSNDAVILMDQNGLIQFANPVVEPMFGFSPHELIGREFSILLPEEQRENFQELFRKYSTAGNLRSRKQVFEITALHRDNREFPVEVAYSHMELSGKRLHVAFLRDVTERKRAEAELRQNEEQFAVAREIQQRLFPSGAPELPGMEITGLSQPAEATGGDYYDFIPMLHGCWAIVVADVSGHGIGPALLMAETRAYLRILAQNRNDVGDILTQANRVLAQDVGQERFVTMLVLKIDPQNRRITFANAGHPSGYIFDSHGNIRATLSRTGAPLGIRSDTHYSSSPGIELHPGDLLLLLTDGFEEALAPEMTVFGIERTLQLIRENRHKSSKEIVECLMSAVKDFSAGAPPLDDLTVVVAKMKE